MPGGTTNQWYRQVFNLLDQGVLVVEEQRIQASNPAFSRLVGIEPEDADGQVVTEFISPDARGEVLQRLASPDGEPFVSLLRPANHDESIPVRIRLHPFKADNGKTQVVMVLRDLRPELERTGAGSGDALSELEQLRATHQMKTQLLNTAAHELNTPITPLRLQTHLLTSGSLGPLNAKQSKAADILDRNVTRLSMLVKDILDVARMDAGTLKMESRPTDLDSVLDDVFESFQETADQVKIRMHRSGLKGTAVMADPDRIVQVLYNLVSNALKFTPANGVIRVHVQEDHDFVHVDVQDTGIGLTKDQIEGLFQPFSQAHDPKDFKATGTGLGLFISRGIVESLEGTLRCTSEGPGRGTTFTLTLPTAAVSSETELATATGYDRPTIKREDEMLERLRELI